VDWIYAITGLDQMNRNVLGIFYARLPDTEKIEAHKLAADLGRQHRQGKNLAKPGEYSYAMLLLALAKMKWTRSDLVKKSNIAAEKARRITELQVRTIKASGPVRKSRKQQALDLQLYHVVRDLRENKKMSWRKIASYLGKYHKLKITHVWAMKTYNRLRKERLLRGEDGDKI